MLGAKSPDTPYCQCTARYTKYCEFRQMLLAKNSAVYTYTPYVLLGRLMTCISSKMLRN